MYGYRNENARSCKMSTMTISHAKHNKTPADFRSLLTVWAKRRRRRRELSALLDQPDYILEDIGVDRRVVLREASKPCSGRTEAKYFSQPTGETHMATLSNHPARAQLGFEHSRQAQPPSLTREILLAAVLTLQRWQSRAAERRLLARMSDYDLKDLGSSRADVEGETAKSFWQP